MMEPKYTVCPSCDGEGWKSKLGAFTGDQMDEWYGENSVEREEFIEEYTKPGGIYDEPCSTCKGQRVVLTAELADLMEYLREQAEEAAVYRAESGDWGW
jgi:hypothetical protein